MKTTGMSKGSVQTSALNHKLARLLTYF